MKTPIALARKQYGVMLLEALVSILIFSIGILAIVALQGTSVKLASDSRYRSDANMLASKYIGEMWLASSSPTFATDFATGGSEYLKLNSSVVTTLPMAGAVSSPAVTINTYSVSSPSSTVTIDIYWQAPGGTGHKYTTSTQITH